MPQTHVLAGLGLDAAVRRVQRQSVLFYNDRSERAQDLPRPWPGATTLVLDGMALEAWNGTTWVPLGGSGGGGTPGVTDHGALTGLGDDDHPQYLTDVRADALFLKPSEVIAGSALDIDRTTTPGSLTLTANADASEWVWTAAAGSGDPGSARVALDADNVVLATVIRISATSGKLINPPWIKWLRAGDNIAIADKGSTNRLRFRVIANVVDNGSWLSIPVQPISGVEPANGTVVTVISYLASGAGTGITQADADLRYVNVAGDTMTGPLVVAGVSGTGNISTTGHINPRYQGVAGLTPVTPVTAWTQFPITALAGATQIGGIVGPTGFVLPEAGLYAFTLFVLIDRVVTGAEMSVQLDGVNVAYNRWASPTPQQRFALSGMVYTSAVHNLAAFMITGGGCIAGGNAESVFHCVSLF